MYVISQYHLWRSIKPAQEAYILPDMSDLLDKNEIRRLGVTVRGAVYSGLKCLQIASVQSPEAIITGTGKGCVSSIEKFQEDIITYKETALNPSIFIQSTHNTVNGLIAIKCDSEVYNTAHVNYDQCIFNVLTDLETHFEQGKVENGLIGFFDEYTPFDDVLYEAGGFNSSTMVTDDDKSIIWSSAINFFFIQKKYLPGAISILSYELYRITETAKIKEFITSLSGTKMRWSMYVVTTIPMNGRTFICHFYQTE